MVETGPLMGALFSLVAGAVYLWVGRVVGARPVKGHDRVANLFFNMWWYSLAGLSFVGAGFGIAAAYDHIDLALNVVLLHTAIILICAALWGLAYFLVYLYTGSPRSLLPLGLFYFVFYLLIDYLIVLQDPVGVKVGQYQTELVYANDYSDVAWLQWALRLFIVPQILGALAYLTLFFKVRDPMLRYRVAMVSGSFLVWFTSGIVAGLLGLTDYEWWGLVSRAIGVLAALAVLMAYKPPAWVLRMLGAPPAPAGGAA